MTDEELLQEWPSIEKTLKDETRHLRCDRQLDMDEACAETRLRVWIHRRTIERGRACGWARVVLRRVVVDMWRHKKWWKELGIDPPSLDPPPEDRAKGEDEARRLHEALGNLQERDAVPLRARYFLDLTVTQVSVLLGCSIGQASKRVSEAAMRLGKILGSDQS
jgi:RNA polymerase sigma factor (sigma-70 family)